MHNIDPELRPLEDPVSAHVPGSYAQDKAASVSSGTDTPNIHLTTIQDFRRFCREHDLEIIEETDLVPGQSACRRVRACANFLATYAIFLLRGKTR